MFVTGAHGKKIVAPPPVLAGAGEAFALTGRRLAELDRLRAMGMAQAETLTEATRQLKDSPIETYRAMAGGKGTIAQFEKISRAVRQIVVLEFEIKGLFKAPDRDGLKKQRLGLGRFDDLNDLNDLYDYDDLDDDEDLWDDLRDLNPLKIRLDYDRGGLDSLIAEIRATLGAEPPADDPFAPAGERRPSRIDAVDRASAILREMTRPAHRPPGMQVRTPAMLAQPVAGTVLSTKPALAKATLPRKGFRIPPTGKHNPNTQAVARKRGPPK
jgi:hypothetical protein